MGCVTFAGFVAVVLAVMIASPVYADCLDGNNNQTYCGAYTGCQRLGDFYYAIVATQSYACYWSNQGYIDCPPVYDTQGAKGNLGTDGGPYVYDDTPPHLQHVLQWMTSEEDPTKCTTGGQTKTGGCWIQVGWQVGSIGMGDGCSNQHTTTATSTTVYVEIYDDSSSPCFLSLFGSAPLNASYDARFYTVSGSYYQYNAYFEVPGSNNIQWLAYADFHTQKTAEQVAGEALDDIDSVNGYCPVLGQTRNGMWNQVGQQASLSTFASHMQLYNNGSWVDWTTSVAPTYGYIWPPNGRDEKGFGNSTNPYQIQAISNWGAGNFTQWETGGPQ